MNTSRFASISSSLLMAVLAAPSTLVAQETVEITGRDQGIDANFEEVYSVGVLEGESWEMFGQVAKVAFDAEGNLCVFDELGSRTVRVLVFDSAGGFLREFGRSGQGPGEFDYPVGFAVLRDGTTVVRDLGHRAYQLFDASGQYLRMVRTSDSPGVAASSGDGRTPSSTRPRGRFATPEQQDDRPTQQRGLTPLPRSSRIPAHAPTVPSPCDSQPRPRNTQTASH